MSTPFEYLGPSLQAYRGIRSGRPTGYLGATASGSRLFGNLTGNSNLTNFGSGLGDLLGIYGGLQRGGVSGYGQATGSGLKLAGLLSNNPALSTAGGYIAAPLGIYNAISNWQSGDTGGDALRGAEAGAAFGPAGMLIGGAIGALSSAFGGGKRDPETGMWNQYKGYVSQHPQASSQIPQMSPAQAFQMLAGVMDAKDPTAGHSQPIEQAFGRMGEGNLLNQMAGQINQAYGSGQIAKGETPQQVWSGVVNPWLQSKTGGQGLIGSEAAPLTGVMENLVQNYMSGNLTNQTPIGISGQIDTTLPQYAGLPQPMGAPVRPMASRFSPTMGRGVRMAAEGGYIDMRKRADGTWERKPSLREIYAGSYRDRLPGYQDGGGYGSYYSSYYNNAPTPSYNNAPLLDPTAQPGYDPQAAREGSLSGGMSSGNISGLPQYQDQPPPDPNQFLIDPGTIQNIPLDSYYTDPNQQLQDIFSGMPGGLGAPGNGVPSLNLNIPPSAQGSLSGLLSSLGLPSGLAGTLGNLAPLLPLLAPALRQQPSAPQLPSQYGGTPMNIQTPNMTRYQNPAYQNMSQQDWLHVGENPMQPFYMNNQLPSTPNSSPNVQGGGIPTPTPMPPSPMPPTSNPGLFNNTTLPMVASPVSNVPRMSIQPLSGAIMATGGHYGPGYVNGPGTGTSDDINARLSDGEYVIDAPTVSLLGAGSNAAGARALDRMRMNVRRHAGRKLVQGKQPMRARAPEQYLTAGYTS